MFRSARSEGKVKVILQGGVYSKTLPTVVATGKVESTFEYMALNGERVFVKDNHSGNVKTHIATSC